MEALVAALSSLFSLFRRSAKVRDVGANRARKELRNLNDDVQKLYSSSPFASDGGDKFIGELVVEAAKRAECPVSLSLLEPFFQATIELMQTEGLWEPPEIDWSIPFTLEEEVELRRYLSAQKKLFTSPRQIDLFRETLVAIFSGILGYLPSHIVKEAQESLPLSFSVAFVDFLEFPGEVIEQFIIGALWNPHLVSTGLFEGLREDVRRNALHVSGIDFSGKYGSERKVLFPTEVKNASGTELVAEYLSSTPFVSLFLHEYPFVIPEDVRFEHCHILGGTGHGKTQVLQSFILGDLERAQKGGCGLLVLDSQGDLIKNIVRLARFCPSQSHGLADKLLLIDPWDVEYPVALNLFAMGVDRGETISPAASEMMANGTVALYEYLFGALFGAELTQRQGVIFRYLAELMMSIPGATIETFRELLEDGKAFRGYMDSLEGSAQAFFKTQYFSPSFSATKKQLLTRLWGVFANRTLERMFSNPENKVDIFSAMNEGKIVLVNTAKDFLKKEGSQLLGRFVIALIGHAVLERALLPREKRLPFFVYIDEAQEYFDEGIEDLLTQARKYKVGITLAHQTLEQLPSRLEGVLLANTSIKFAGGVNAKDAQILSREMRTTAECILETKKRRTFTEFVCFAKNVTPRAMKLSVPLGVMESEPKQSDREFEALMVLNRERYCVRASERKKRLVTPKPESATAAREETKEVERREIPEAPFLETVSEVSPLSTPSVSPSPPITAIPAAPLTPAPVVTPLPSEEVAKPKASRPSAPPPPPPLGRGGAEHKYLQSLIKRCAEERGFRATIEKEIPPGAGSIDVVLERNDKNIACEISVTTSASNEFGNVEKCLSAGYDTVILLSSDSKHLRALKEQIEPKLEPKDAHKVLFFLPEEFIAYLEQQEATAAGTEKIVKGYKVKVKYKTVDDDEQKARRQAIAKVIVQSMKRMNIM